MQKRSEQYSTSEEGEFADRVTEQHVLLEVVQIHNILEDILKVGAHQVNVLLQMQTQTSTDGTLCMLAPL